ncbi:Fc.00g013430.m01.CDS01 [Cosmosporella sp. VM-42]
MEGDSPAAAAAKRKLQDMETPDKQNSKGEAGATTTPRTTSGRNAKRGRIAMSQNVVHEEHDEEDPDERQKAERLTHEMRDMANTIDKDDEKPQAVYDGLVSQALIMLGLDPDKYKLLIVDTRLKLIGTNAMHATSWNSWNGGRNVKDKLTEAVRRYDRQKQ